MSMPEEVNRLVADQISAMHLTPTPEAGRNLVSENVDESRIHFVGNIMAESVLRHVAEIEGREVCSRFELEPGDYVLSTIHRPENTDHPEKLGQIAAAFAEAPHPVLLPVHPRTRPVLAEHGMTEGSANIVLTDPVGYLDMLALQRDAAAIVTDSGGVQEESCMLGTPCVTVRRNTERGITVEVGANRLVSAEREAILGGSGRGADCEPRLGAARAMGRPGRRANRRGARCSGIEPMVGY